MAYDLTQYYGIPYAEMNCYELFRHVQKEIFGIEVKEYAVPDTLKGQITLMGNASERENWYQVDFPQDGDAVLMKRKSLKKPSHIGIWINEGILHTTGSMGSHWVNEERLEFYKVEIDSLWRYEK